MTAPRMAMARCTAGVLMAALLIAGCSSSSGGGATSTPAPSVTSSATAASSAPSSTPPPKPTAAQVRAAVNAKIKKMIASHRSGSISVAAVNTVSGKQYSAGATSGMWTASAYKLYVLEALLVEQGGSLSDAQADEAARAIENSDNVAGYSLFLAAGGNGGLSSAASRFGMSHTVPGESDPTFTRTSARDCLRLLRNLVDKHGPFGAETRSFVLGLMRNVESDQRWGVGAVADKGSTFYNKNGWLSVDDSNGPGEADDGLWITTSVGIVTIKGQRVLMAVLTQHNRSFDDGVALVQRLARTIAPAVSKI